MPHGLTDEGLSGGQPGKPLLVEAESSSRVAVGYGYSGSSC